MAGLIIEQMIRRKFGSKLMFPIFIIIAAIILCFFREQIMVHGFAALVAIIIPVSGLFISVQDCSNHWNKYEKILPVSGSRIVLSKLICYLIDTAIAFMFVSIFCGIAFSVDASLFDMGLMDAFILLIVLLTVVVFIGSSYYGGLYLIGEEKSYIWIFICIVASFVVTGIIVMLVNKSGVEKVPGLIIMLCISALTLALSYLAASRTFKK